MRYFYHYGYYLPIPYKDGIKCWRTTNNLIEIKGGKEAFDSLMKLELEIIEKQKSSDLVDGFHYERYGHHFPIACEHVPNDRVVIRLFRSDKYKKPVPRI